MIVGEGGSGGAVAIATANKVLMLEHSIYTVASPEAAASILWRDSSRAQDAATSMKITAQDLLKFGIIDAIVPEPFGGAHRNPEAAVDRHRQGDRRGTRAAGQYVARAGARGARRQIPQHRPQGVSDCLGRQAFCHFDFVRMMALSVRSCRMQATMATFLGFPRWTSRA